MQFFREGKLAARLQQELVSEKEQALYLLFTFLIMTFFCTATVANSIYGQIELNIYDRLIDLAMIVFVFISMFIGFKINQNGDKTNFVKRYICISFPIAMKVFILTFTLGIITGLLDNPNYLSPDYNAALDTKSSAGPYGFTLVLLIYLYSIWCMATSMKIASGQKEYNL
jgi:hypothetical protein